MIPYILRQNPCDPRAAVPTKVKTCPDCQGVGMQSDPETGERIAFCPTCSGLGSVARQRPKGRFAADP